MTSRCCLAAAIGASVAHGDGLIPAALFAGVCDTQEEAQELAFRANKKRNERKFAAAAARGPAGVLGMR